MTAATTVREEEVRALFRQGGAILWAHVAVGTVVAGNAWSEGYRARAASWLAALLLMTLGRLAVHRQYRRRAMDTELATWGRRFVLGSAAAGVLWGAAGLLFFFAQDPQSQALLTFAIGGMLAAAAGTLACHLPAFYVFFVSALAPLTLRMMAEGNREHGAMAAMTLAYALAMHYVARNNHRSFTRAFELSQERAALIAELSRSRQELEQRVEARTAQLEQRSEALRRAQRLEAVGKLAGSLAHDFNNLLTVVLSNATTLKDGSTDEEHRHASADETLQAARRGAGLIRQLLSLTHRQRTEPRVFSMNQLVAGSSSVLRRLAGESVTLSVELGAEPSFVRADPAQMEQVLMNLASAACAAMPRGGRLWIRTIAGEGSVVKLSVEDDGDGRHEAPTSVDGACDQFPASAAEAFDRSLGLAVARTIIEEADGRFVVDASASRGTHFRVELPAVREPVTTAPPTQAPGVRATILAVDDEPSLRAVIRRSLTREGYDVLIAEDGERALALASRHLHEIDLLVTDVIMPGLSGPDLARRLRAERPRLGVLFISGYSFDESLPAIDSSDGIDYLAKPFDATTLSAKVRQLLGAVQERSGVRDVG